jgi:hypothetical protein
MTQNAVVVTVRVSVMGSCPGLRQAYSFGILLENIREISVTFAWVPREKRCPLLPLLQHHRLIVFMQVYIYVCVCVCIFLRKIYKHLCVLKINIQISVCLNYSEMCVE